MQIESPPEPGQKNSDIIHYQKINIFGEVGVGKSSLISLIENFDDDNFKIQENNLSKSQISLDSNYSSFLIEQIKRVKIPLNENKDLFLNLYETNLDDYDTIKINLDTLLFQTECIIFMWDGNKEETFDNIPNLFSSINKGIKDNKFRNVPIFLIQNKKDLNINLSKDNLEKNKIKESIETIKKENNNIEFKEISLLEKDDFMDLILDINRKLFNQKEKSLNNNDVVNLVKFNQKPIPENNKTNDFIIIKSIFLGDSNVGKRTFIKYIQGEKNKTYISTIGKDSIFIQANINKENAYIQIFDTCGQERYNSVAKNYLNNVDAILLFYDVTNRESFENLDNWIDKITDTIDLKEISLILAANKIDENEKRIISKKEGIQKADKYGIKYYECCCSNGLNIYEILNELILEGYYRNCEKKVNKVNLSRSLNDINSKDENYDGSKRCNC